MIFQQYWGIVRNDDNPVRILVLVAANNVRHGKRRSTVRLSRPYQQSHPSTCPQFGYQRFPQCLNRLALRPSTFGRVYVHRHVPGLHHRFSQRHHPQVSA